MQITDVLWGVGPTSQGGSTLDAQWYACSDLLQAFFVNTLPSWSDWKNDNDGMIKKYINSCYDTAKVYNWHMSE